MDSNAREMRPSDRYYYVLPSVASFVSWTGRYEHSFHTTANGLAEEWIEKSMPSKGVLDRISGIYHGGRGER
jgi:hypothetical protein